MDRSPDPFEDWQLRVALKQQAIYMTLGNRQWDLLEPVNGQPVYDQLLSKVSYCFFEKSFDEADLDEKYRKTVTDTVDKIRSISDNDLRRCYFHVVYVFTRSVKNGEEGCTPLIRVSFECNREDMLFVEPQPGRVYRGWSDYLKNNKLPKCYMCYPCHGIYSKSSKTELVMVEFEKSCACNVALKAVDNVATVSNVAASGVYVSSFLIPPLAAMTTLVYGSAVAISATSAYMASRNGYQLYNMKRHDENIRLNNNEALVAWLGLGGNVVGGLAVGSTSLVSKLSGAAVQEVDGWKTTVLYVLKKLCGDAGGTDIWAKGLAMTLMTLRYVSVASNVLGVITCLTKLCVKFRKGTLNKSDLKTFTCACLFFANIIVTEACAERVISILSDKPTTFGCIFKMTSVWTIVQAISYVHSSTDLLNKILPIDVCDMIDTMSCGIGIKNTCTSLAQDLCRLSFEECDLGNVALKCSSLVTHLTLGLEESNREYEDMTDIASDVDHNCNSLARLRCLTSADKIVKVVNVSSMIFCEMMRLEFFEMAKRSTPSSIDEKHLTKTCEILSQRIINEYNARAIVMESKKMLTDNVKQQLYDQVRRNIDWNRDSLQFQDPSDIHFEQPLYACENKKLFVFVRPLAEPINVRACQEIATRLLSFKCEYCAENVQDKLICLYNDHGYAYFYFNKMNDKYNIGIVFASKDE